VLFRGGKLLLPAEGLTQNPKRERNGDEEQAQTNRATPAEPRTPRPPVFQMVVVVIAVVLFKVLETFALVLHSIPLLIDEGLSPNRFDDSLERRRPTHSSSVVLVSVHVIRRMSSAWLQETTTLKIFKHKMIDTATN